MLAMISTKCAYFAGNTLCLFLFDDLTIIVRRFLRFAGFVYDILCKKAVGNSAFYRSVYIFK